MALSLADELAGLDGAPMGGSSMGLGGVSLADEFGLDAEGGEIGGDGLIDTSTDPLDIPPVRRSGRPPPHIQDSPPTIPPLLSPHATPPNLPFRPLKDGRGQGSRTAKSSSTSTSGYGPSSPRTTHDETDVDALLDPETSFNTTAETSWHTAPMHPTLSPLDSPVPSSPTLTSVPSPPGDPVGFLGHRIERDPLVELSEVLETNRRFIDTLLRLDDTVHAPGLPVPTEPIEAKMQRHLERLHEADRAREEQCRHLAVLARDMAGMRWDEAAEDALTGLLDLLPIHPLPEDRAPEQDIGWVGELGNVGNTRHGVTHDQSLERDPFLSPLSPIDVGTIPRDNDMDHPLSPLSDSSHLDLSPPSRPFVASLAALPTTTRDILSSSNDLLATLARLGDAIRQSASASAGSSRRIRGLSSSIDSWRERETLEEGAKVAVEAYERRCLESGLKAGSGLTVKEQLEREMASFEEVLDLAGERMDEVRREAAFRVAVM